MNGINYKIIKTTAFANLKTCFLLLIFTFFLVLNQGRSQTRVHSTFLSYGNFTVDEYLYKQSAILPNQYAVQNPQSKGVVFMGFEYILSNKIRAGATIGAGKITRDLYLIGQKEGTLNRQLYTLAVESEFIYFKKAKVELFALAGTGCSLGYDEYFTLSGPTDKGFIGYLNFQISPACIRYGNQMALFAEFGFGYKGIFNVGFAYTLHPAGN